MVDQAEPAIPFATAAHVALQFASEDAPGRERMRHLADKRQPVPSWKDAWAWIGDFIKSAGIDKDAFKAELRAAHARDVEALAEADALIERLRVAVAEDSARQRRARRSRATLHPSANGGSAPELSLEHAPDYANPVWSWLRETRLALVKRPEVMEP